MILRLELNEAISGFWDGGKKRFFDFTIEKPISSDLKGKYVKIGCYDMNYWFNVAWSGSQKKTFANVKRKFAHKFKRQGIKSTWSYVR